MDDNITIPKEQLDLMVTKANMELIARLDTLITKLEQQHTKKEWVEVKCPLCGEMAVAHTHPNLQEKNT